VNQSKLPCPPLAVHHFRTHEVIEIDPEDIEEAEYRETEDSGPFCVLKMRRNPMREVPIREDFPALIVMLAKVAEHVATLILWQLLNKLTKS